MTPFNFLPAAAIAPRMRPRSLSVTQESPDSVHDMIDVAHAYIHHAVDQMYQSPPPLMNKPENLQNTKAMHAHQSNPTKSQSAMR